MSLNIKRFIFFCLLAPFTIGAETTFETILKESVIKNGFRSAEDIMQPVDQELAVIGKGLFESEAMSLNGQISCQSCHLDKFGSADGIPVAVGIGGVGEGKERAMSGGAIIPRNTLPLWGRGHKGFDVLFWDGRVDFSNSQKISAFGNSPPSTDPLITAIHLPAVEIREMLIEDKFIKESKQEEVSSAQKVYQSIANNIQQQDNELYERVKAHFNLIEEEQVTFTHMAEAIAAFIRSKFAIKNTKFHKFIFDSQSLSEDEFKGALLFYGKAKCSTCHSGSYLTDFSFHSLALFQLGFGRNGFGVDYGRYNVTHDPKDLYKFRTPPLYNVSKTAPYGHSGSINNLESMVVAHFDPLSLIDPQAWTVGERTEYYKRLVSAAEDLIQIPYLTDKEVAQILTFLETLEYE